MTTNYIEVMEQVKAGLCNEAYQDHLPEIINLLTAAIEAAKNVEPFAYAEFIESPDGASDVLFHSPHNTTWRDKFRKLFIAPPAQPAPAGYKLVPKELLDRFPELNTSNYGPDEIDALNSWGIEVVLAAAPEAQA